MYDGRVGVGGGSTLDRDGGVDGSGTLNGSGGKSSTAREKRRMRCLADTSKVC